MVNRLDTGRSKAVPRTTPRTRGRMSQRQGKYNAIKTEVDGYVFASRREANRYQELRLLERVGEIEDLELQPVYPCVVNDVLVCKYIADFRYTALPRGNVVVEDAKGVKTAVYRLKNKLVCAIYGVVIIEV